MLSKGINAITIVVRMENLYSFTTKYIEVSHPPPKPTKMTILAKLESIRNTFQSLLKSTKDKEEKSEKDRDRDRDI